MLDPKLFRDDIQAVAKRLKAHNFNLDTHKMSELEHKRKTLQAETENLQAARNKSAKEIGKAKAQGQDIAPLLQEVEKIGTSLKEHEQTLKSLLSEQHTLLLTIPNLLDESVPQGNDEDDNIELRRVGTPKTFNFTAKDHVALGEQKNDMDFELAAKLSGARFVVLKRQLAHLHRALTQFMLDTHINSEGF